MNMAKVQHNLWRRFVTGGLLMIALASTMAVSASARADEDKDRWNIFKKKDKKDAPLAQAPRKAGDKEIWTIECRVCTGQGHAAEAETYAKSLRNVRELKPNLVSILKEKDRSRVIYGQYELKYVRAAGNEVVIEQKNTQIQNDLNFIKKLASGEVHPFLTARTMAMPTEDVGPPEWDLRTAKGYYTLQVGVTFATPALHDYKGAAVEWVRALRQDGYEAYYYHNPDSQRSSVCVGTFGPDAMVKERDGTQHYSDAVLRLQSKGDLGFNLENGHKVWRTTGPTRDKTGKVVSTGGRSANQSFLVKIPGKETPVARPARGRP